MKDLIPAIGKHIVIQKSGLQDVLDALKTSGYKVIGPSLSQEAIIYDAIEGTEDLPIGWNDEQGPGEYKVQDRNDGRYFSYVVGPTTWKRFLYPPELSLFHCQQSEGGLEFQSKREPTKYAFVGVRSCELAAISIQDRILLEGIYQDPHYRDRREQVFILAVNCSEPGETCFCSSMGTGPRCRSGFDLALTELSDAFLLEVGSEVGAEILSGCAWRPAGAFEMDQASRIMTLAKAEMGRMLDTNDLPDLLYDNLDSPRWEAIAQRCLSCTNCTLVCPTCFCVDVQDLSDLSGQHTERRRKWDSCFSTDFSYVHGGNSRPTIRSRYRQWLTHKLASWVDQFGQLGCVGCGRCITWCPVGIDLTEEIAAIREGAPA
jgi:sulfhydrogenase subunit beta (sulfur reductase)